MKKFMNKNDNCILLLVYVLNNNNIIQLFKPTALCTIKTLNPAKKKYPSIPNINLQISNQSNHWKSLKPRIFLNLIPKI